MSTQNTYISQSLWFLWVGALIINTISFLTIWYKIHPSGLPVALHYTVLSGIDILGPGTELYKVPFIGSLVFVVNLILSFRLRKDQFLQIACAALSFIANLVLLCAIILIIRAN